MDIETFIDVDEFVKEIEEPIEDLTEAMRTQTARAAHYSMKATKAKKQRDRVALIVKTIEAQLTKTCRQALMKAANDLAEEENTKPERITADMVKAEVALHPVMRSWLEKQIDADEVYSVCKAAYDAFYTRREMLTSMGHMTREQMRANLTIRGAAETTKGYRERRAEREAQRAAQKEGETES